MLLFQGVRNWTQYSTISLALLLQGDDSNDRVLNNYSTILLQESMNMLATTCNPNDDINTLYKQTLQDNKTSIDLISTWVIEHLLQLTTWKVC